jgi:hypothetical protein
MKKIVTFGFFLLMGIGLVAAELDGYETDEAPEEERSDMQYFWWYTGCMGDDSCLHLLRNYLKGCGKSWNGGFNRFILKRRIQNGRKDLLGPFKDISPVPCRLALYAFFGDVRRFSREVLSTGGKWCSLKKEVVGRGNAKWITTKSFYFNGMLPAHLAALGGHLKVMKIIKHLCEEQLFLKDSCGNTPLAIAKAFKREKVVAFLVPFYEERDYSLKAAVDASEEAASARREKDREEESQRRKEEEEYLKKREEAAQALSQEKDAYTRTKILGAGRWIKGVNHFGSFDGASDAWGTLEERFWRLKEEIEELSLTKELDELGGVDLEKLGRDLERSKKELLDVQRKLQCFGEKIPCACRKCKQEGFIYPGDATQKLTCGRCKQNLLMHQGCLDAIRRHKFKHTGCEELLEKRKAIPIDWEAAA